MDRIVSARVFTRPSRPLAAEELRLTEVRDDLVRVRLRSSGVCHSDLHIAAGEWTADGPLVLGHEGAGVVEAVGPDVRDVRPGDHVILSWFAPCRRCEQCARGRSWTIHVPSFRKVAAFVGASVLVQSRPLGHP